MSYLKNWMKQHYSRDSGLPLGDVDSLGTVTVTTTLMQPSRATASDIGSNPPITSLPPNASPGDTITVNSCINKQEESWTFVWVPNINGNGTGGGWSLQAYKGARVKACPGGGA
ncbi:hypothetical protein [Xanthomonas graminis]|uniref:hypothetical protein n=1 Tax=Xanthomonas graminis TaxID=3390026 RepID=UPI00118746C0|nr:hypothetical protein [Xanthomonas translucens]UKE77655.1 hypothetical protein KM317_20025 [Xanthomonas translucens pv. arrhenatheri]